MSARLHLSIMATTLVTRQSLKFSLDVPVLCNKSAGLQESAELRLHKLYLVCVIAQMAEHLVQVWPSTKDMGGNMPVLNVEEVLTAFKRDLLE